MGRPSKFTPEVLEILLERIEKGNFLSVAAAYAGVGYPTFKAWMKRGRSKAPADAGFRAFRAAVRRARAKAEVDAVERITQAKTESGDRWFLERSFRDRWAQKVEVTGRNGSPLIPPESQKRMLADPRALLLACELDAILASPDAGGLGPPGEPGEVGLPAPPGPAEP